MLWTKKKISERERERGSEVVYSDQRSEQINASISNEGPLVLETEVRVTQN